MIAIRAKIMIKTCFVFLASALCTVVQAQRPNIVFIMADDLGLGDVSHYREQLGGEGSLGMTPSIDGLAKDGIWFTDAHSSTALCSPTRYCVMSGNLNYRSYAPWGVWGTFRENAIKPGQATLATVTKNAGYKTGFIGKWHLGGDFLDKKTGKVYRGADRGTPDTTVDVTRIVGGGPKSLGFDYSLMLPCGIQGPIYTAYENEQWYPLNPQSKIVYLDDKSAIDARFVSDKGPGLGDSHWDTRDIGKLISAKAVDFIRDNAGNTPFFLCYWSPMVHVPHCPPEEFDGLKIAGTTPSRHLDMLRDLDQQVARIVKALKASGQYENTLIVFTSDNGGLSSSVRFGHDSSGAWRGFKNAAHEGGHRVPFIAVWKDKIGAGAVCDEPIVNHDMLATMAALLNVKVPADQAMDSLNLLPLLTGEGTFRRRQSMLLQAGSKNEVIYREGAWKLILQSDHRVSKFDPIALFHLDDNPTEQEAQNLVKDPQHIERVQSMRDKYVRLRESGARTTPLP